jgi:hypothetical protein
MVEPRDFESMKKHQNDNLTSIRDKFVGGSGEGPESSKANALGSGRPEIKEPEYADWFVKEYEGIQTHPQCNCDMPGAAGGNCEIHGPWRNDEYAHWNGKSREDKRNLEIHKELYDLKRKCKSLCWSCYLLAGALILNAVGDIIGLWN